MILVGGALFFWAIGSTSWADTIEGEIKPGHVFARAELIQKEVDLIRLEMGKPEPVFLKINIANAQPRDVYYQALTLYKKADRLCFDHTGDTGPIPPQMEEGEISPGDNFEILNGAMSRIRCVSVKWDIPESVIEYKLDINKTPSDVYGKILEINRQLNSLLDTPYSPSVVYRRMNETNEAVKRIISRNNSDMEFPSLPEFERRKKPSDVYFQTLKCLNILRRISHFLKIQHLDFKVAKSTVKVEPGDVYDLVSLVLSGVNQIRKTLDPESFESIQKKVPFPSRKFPSHVYQKAVYLERLMLKWEEMLKNKNFDS